MIDTLAEKELNGAVQSELINIRNVYGKQYSSLHEGYAVLLEEVEEAANELERIKEELSDLWLCVKEDDQNGAAEALRHLECHAFFGLQELCQVCAVTKKFRGV